ncbi:MAG: AI-2E family transporter [Patescibacteria group bacterium]|jgi:predicted PurR-regulated permease PerM
MASNGSRNININISSGTLFKILFLIIAIVFLFFIRDIVLLVFVALILSAAINPWVNWLQKFKIPRALSILFIYCILFLILGGAIYLIIPPIATEMNGFIQDFPNYWGKATGELNAFRDYFNAQGLGDNISNALNSLQTNLSQFAGGLFGQLFSFLGGIFSIFMLLVLTFYFSADDQFFKRSVRVFIPIKYQPYSTQLINRMQEKIGLWLRGQLILCLIIFTMSWLGLTLLGVKYALVLAVFAGVTEFIPYLGPFLGAIPAVFVGFTQAPYLGLLVIALYIIIQQAENLFLVPMVMKKAVGLNPVVVIISMLIGGTMAGMLGILIAIPVATAIGVAVSDFVDFRKE